MFRLVQKNIQKRVNKIKKLNYNFNIISLILIFSCSLIFPQHTLADNYLVEEDSLSIQGIIVDDTLLSILNSDIVRLPVRSSRLPEIKDRKLENTTSRYITAYNVGVVAQTDNTPCIGASGDNLCDLVEQGINICAANFVPLGTNLEIEGIGICKVLDRMNARYTSRVDIAMGPDEITEAREFGLQLREVGIY